MQRIATAAVSGAVASTVAMSLHRSFIEPFQDYMHRRKQVAALRKSYEKELDRADAFAMSLALDFVKKYPEEALRVFGSDMQSDPTDDPLQPFIDRVYSYVWSHRHAAIATEYHSKLAAISTRLADREEYYVVWLQDERDDEHEKMFIDGYPMTKLLNWIENFKQ